MILIFDLSFYLSIRLEHAMWYTIITTGSRITEQYHRDLLYTTKIKERETRLKFVISNMPTIYLFHFFQMSPKKTKGFYIRTFIPRNTSIKKSYQPETRF